MEKGIATWVVGDPQTEIRQLLVSSLGLHPVTGQILANRGLSSVEDARRFLNPSLSQLHDPYLLPDMEQAVARIAKAIYDKERILFVGDYDTDGVVGTSVAIRFLKAIGVDARYVIPRRVTEGYGLSVVLLERAFAEGPCPKLIVTIDNGTTSHAALSWTHERGVDVIVTDHHEVMAKPPSAFAFVNPKRRDVATPYPFDGLCGAGVIFKLLTALRHRLRTNGFFADRAEPNIARWLDMIAVATIADVVPLTNENRIICHYGLRRIATTTTIGLKALCEAAGVKTSSCDTRTVAFQIAPRLNAAGRLADAATAVELLTTDDEARAREIAQELHAINARRQSIEEQIMRDVKEELMRGDADRMSIVAASEKWEPGVVGIVAGRLAAEYRVPTILISLASEKGIGSARGVGDFPLLDALSKCGHLLERFGGHAKAGGVTVLPHNVAEFRATFDDAARELIRPEHREDTVKIDALVSPEEINDQLVSELSSLAPFGEGNPEPVLCLKDVGVRQRRIVGGRHLKLTVHGGTILFDAIGFSMAEHPHKDVDRLDLACMPEYNEWNGVTSVQLKLRDIKTA